MRKESFTLYLTLGFYFPDGFYFWPVPSFFGCFPLELNTLVTFCGVLVRLLSRDPVLAVNSIRLIICYFYEYQPINNQQIT
jgi:hypothetical protein